MPDHLLAPDLDLVEVMLLDAFNELGADRAIGFGLGPIPFSSIDRYATRLGYDDPDEFAFFKRAIRAMDAVFLAAVNKPTTKTP